MLVSYLSRKRVQNYVDALAVGDSHDALDEREVSAGEDVLFRNAILFHKELVPVSLQYIANILGIIEHIPLFSPASTPLRRSPPQHFSRN